jgi:hypothetical protein
MTEQDTDSLYEKAIDAINGLKPIPGKDFEHIQTYDKSPIEIKVQALNNDTFSVRIVKDSSEPVYVQGSKGEILFSLRHFIRKTTQDSKPRDAFSNYGNSWAAGVDVKVVDAISESLEQFVGKSGINFLPRGRP